MNLEVKSFHKRCRSLINKMINFFSVKFFCFSFYMISGQKWNFPLIFLITSFIFVVHAQFSWVYSYTLNKPTDMLSIYIIIQKIQQKPLYPSAVCYFEPRGGTNELNKFFWVKKINFVKYV